MKKRLCRIRRRIIWIGGWELANCGGWRLKTGGKWMHPYPVEFFGLITFYAWGMQIGRPRNVLTIRWRYRHYAYISPDGTPNRATRWLWGKPKGT